ncbi:MAG TPA: four helix bundle protein [Candidatus Sulfotelmatobacter sp.]|nr:four helix bundle protein [Candidatus Sulfotelmatobacter sp.]
MLEVETQLQIAHEMKFLPPDDCATLLGECAEVGRILNGLMASLPRAGR